MSKKDLFEELNKIPEEYINNSYGEITEEDLDVSTGDFTDKNINNSDWEIADEYSDDSDDDMEADDENIGDEKPVSYGYGSQAAGKTAAARKKEVRLIKVAMVEAVIAILLIFVYTEITKEKALPVTVAEDAYTFNLEPGTLAARIQDNYMAYLKKSYILIGTYPDCQFIKITDKYARNDYDAEEFYIEEGTDYMYYHADGQRASRLAIDVSTYQSEINWTEVKNAGIDVAIVRIGFRGYGSGDIVLDEMYNNHMSGAEAAGMELGVYFFTQAVSYEEGVEEAQFVLSNLGSYNVTQPIVIDTELIENADGRANNIDNTARTDAILGFCDTIRAAGYTPMIYANRNWFALNIDMTRLGDYELWLAAYANQPDFPYMYYGWQYTNQATVPGVKNPADLNVWFK